MKSFFKILLVTLSVIAVGFSQNKKTIVKEVTINFDSASSVISEMESQKVNETLKDLMNDKNSYSFEISAYTDSKGSVDYNKELSVQRAISSANFLVNSGFLSRKISFTAKGEFDPLADNDSEIGRAKNRRVKVKIYLFDDNKNSISGFTIQEKAYTINATVPQEVTYDSGTIIKIPENAFVDKNGNPISGEVQLNYIEYRDPVDFILGNIPMDYTQNGEKFYFNSAGMFKIQASKDGQEVFLGKNKNLDLDFKLTESLPDLNFYEFKPEHNQWNELHKINGGTTTWQQLPTFDTIANRVIYRTYERCDSVYRNIKAGIELAKDTASLYKKFYAVTKEQYKIYQKDILYKRNKMNRTSVKLSNAEKSTTQYTLLCTIKGVKSKKGEEGFTVFVDNNSALQKLAKVVWIPMGNTLKNTSFSEGKKRLILLEEVSKDRYKMVLKTKNDTIVLDDLKPVSDEIATAQTLDYAVKSSGLIVANFSKKLELLSQNRTVLFTEKDDLAKQIETEKKYSYYPVHFRVENNFTLTNFWQLSKKYMSSDELQMPMDDWFKFFDQNKPMMLERYNSNKNVAEYEKCDKFREEVVANQKQIFQANSSAVETMKSLRISNLGIYNCDQIQRLQEPLIVNAGYENEKGEIIIPLFIYIVDKKINGVLRYDGYGGYSPSRFAYNPKSKTTLLAFDANGIAYIFGSEKFKELSPKGKEIDFKFVVSKIETIQNKAQLKELLN